MRLIDRLLEWWFFFRRRCANCGRRAQTYDRPPVGNPILSCYDCMGDGEWEW